jgi:hypothetical protein
MVPLKPYRFVLALAAVCVALPAVAVGARLPQSGASPSAPASNTTTYQDSTGEDPLAPDISTIVASNDDSGSLTFRITVSNRPEFTPDMAMLMFLDSDAKQGTGDASAFGANYAIQLLQGEILLFKWNGTDYTLAATQSSLSYSWSGGIATVRISASDLSNTRRLRFNVVVFSGVVIDPTTQEPPDFTNAKRDLAPTVGLYSYDLKLTPPKLVVKQFTHTPARPVAGKPFTLRLTAARSDTGSVLQGGRVVCVGRIGSARIVATTHRVTGGAAVCTFRIPKTAIGKAFRGSDTVVFEGMQATRSFSGKIH